jgi:galactose mutarotase-like enzyme
MTFEIQNDRLRVTMDDIGAQVLSVKDWAGTEYMWQRDPNIWPRTAPVLFPVIGRLRNNAYIVNGKEYPMKRHGFARDMPFLVTAQTDTSLVFSVSADEKTKANYPYDFTLDISYQLAGASLSKTHTVTNHSADEMFFELGGHDGFRVALDAGESMADYYICFEGEFELHPLLKTENFLFSNERGNIPLDDGKLWLKMDLFRQDALVLDQLQSRKVMLSNAKGNRRIGFAFPDFPLLGIWTPDKPFDTNFVCLEAWSSLPDSLMAGMELRSKSHICRLNAGEQKIFVYMTNFFL